MPRKRREPYGKHAYRRTPGDGTTLAALRLKSWAAFWGDETEARQAWAAMAPMWPAAPASRPAPFWAYTDGVPAALRMDPPDDDVRIVLGDPPLAADSARAELRAARLRWLLGDGAAHLRPGEADHVRHALDRIQGGRRAA